MKAKQKVQLIAAQYTQLAREMTKQGDSIADLAKVLTESEAQRVVDELVSLELVDSDGVLTVQMAGLGEALGGVRVN